ncbi:hypothetical protein [Leifsonia aquatica]|uniref:hypothetical protein n=1 Tax=Leifsonia aquatica TaxID=144185 RepID=UPI0028AB2058|nr:hypothetical protein [Leifsonia aquatica]
MSLAATADIVHLWTEGDAPVRLGWGGRRYRILAATPVRSVVGHDSLTHPAERLIGWDVLAQLDDGADEKLRIGLRSFGVGWVIATTATA